jgi:hypothetical protein
MIYRAICDVMQDIGAVGKNQRNTTQGFMFRGIDAVMNAISPALIKHKVFVVPEILEQSREERTTAKGTQLIYSICRIKYTFYAEDGSSVSAITIGEGMDSGDKATNKAMAIAFKYACFQVFCIPTEEMVDPDSESPEVKGAGKKPSKTKQEVVSSANGASAKVTQAMVTTIVEKIKKYEPKGVKLEKILALYKVKTLNDMTVDNFKDFMSKMELYGGSGNE